MHFKFQIALQITLSRKQSLFSKAGAYYQESIPIYLSEQNALSEY